LRLLERTMPQKSKIFWSRPQELHGTLIRMSKCGRFAIVARRYSTRNGKLGRCTYYLVYRHHQILSARAHDTLHDARDSATELAENGCTPLGHSADTLAAGYERDRSWIVRC
jgi:hypothetical protein